MALILASKSPRRVELIQKITTDVKVVPSDVEEVVPEGTPPEKVAQVLSGIKALWVARQYPDELILGADTVVVLGETIMGKPKDQDDCRRMMKALSGAVHQVYTGVTLVQRGETESFTCRTDVEFYPLSEQEIEEYVRSDEPYDKAGGYGIQGHAGLFVKRIDGDYFNIMGLPLSMVYQRLKGRL